MTSTDLVSPGLNVLIVDDEANIRKTMSYCLTAEGHTVSAVGNPADALGEIRRKAFDLAFVDLRLGADDGMELIPLLASESPWTKIVVITGYASIESVVEAMQRGATDYIVKPFSTNQLKIISRRVGRVRELENQVASLKEGLERLGPEERLQSACAGMQRAIETAKKAASSEAIVLILGESGVGKTVFARAIHHWSRRSSRPMAVVSCPALPQTLLESELFGYAKGAFTGAVRDYPGRIAACEGGTLFLDEIADIAASAQAKLLRFIQDKEFERLGESVSRRADVRIVAATNADLERLVEEGRFREDLYYRLNVISLTVPPLRERREDIPGMANDFLAHFAKVNHKTITGFTEQAEQALMDHAWPGNVRELRNVVERAVILGVGESIGVGDLFDGAPNPATAVSLGDLVPLATMEEQHIRRVLAKTSSLQEAADILGIDQTTLWRRRKAYGI
ncbi:sigma-54 dependent transcriptional regulator [Pseudodesulfovibrio thermohalotolerans]|uniref:sigma-54-dependent transcriptional regulator n=1 Tax=Pseudodesulfovibrio thermohalotolerans TaxID=2880651 RepID=UPI0024432015|nr:sigma-54 dependent transcriptional regulator [Pseudodesulfovibrio thermohalotolerans]WFS63090.1 sigma-54 dependent transcriptional regulator [Pseudodesulfovibrio thermohalotolerans]